MKLTDQLCEVAETYRSTRKLSVSRVSTLVFGDGIKLSAIRDRGADLTTGRFEHALRWFSENWPDGAEWPAGVPRPIAAQHDAASSIAPASIPFTPDPKGANA